MRPFYRISVFLFAAITLIFSVPSVSQGATITVETLQDEINNDGECSLREAINNANQAAGTDTTGGDCETGDGGALDTLVFEAGLTGGVITLIGSTLPQVTEALTINGPVPQDSSGIILDGANSFRILDIMGTTPGDFQVELNHLTLRNGYTLAQGQRGAAVRALSADLNLNFTLVTGNTTEGQNANGGAIFLQDGELTVHQSWLNGNQTLGQNADGGALAVQDGNATLTDCTVAENSANGQNADGGGLFADTGDLTITRCTLSGNFTVDDDAEGGGLTVEDGNAFLTNTTVTGNFTQGVDSEGGGIFLDESNGTLLHSTVAFNTAADGTDGVHLLNPADMLILDNTLIVQERAGEVACSKAADSGANNLATDASCVGAATSIADIDLQPLGDNGGPTETHALGLNSLALDAAGDCVGDHALTQDQRGAPRPGGPNCDIGAFEVQNICGDTFLDPGEECDDGNTADGDGCDSSCRIEVPPGGDGDGDGDGTGTTGFFLSGGGCALNGPETAAPYSVLFLSIAIVSLLVWKRRSEL